MHLLFLLPPTGLYHAAQAGLSLKPSSPKFLYNLLDILENLKREIGPNDAIDVESASVAYVENFAVKVFAAADDEDRKGAATRYVPITFICLWRPQPPQSDSEEVSCGCALSPGPTGFSQVRKFRIRVFFFTLLEIIYVLSTRRE